MFKLLSSTYYPPIPALLSIFSTSENLFNTIDHIKELGVIFFFFLLPHSNLWTLSPKCTPDSFIFFHLHCYHSRANHYYLPKNVNSLFNLSSYNPFSTQKASETDDKSKSNISYLCIKSMNDFFHLEEYSISSGGPK